MEIKVMRGSQLPACFQSFIIEGNESFHWTPAVTQADWEQKFTLYFVVVDADRIQGYIATHHLFERMEINGVYVSPLSRRKGYGRALLEAVIAYSQCHDITQLFLEVRASNLAALNLYESLGFRTLERRSNYYRSPVEDAIVMHCPVERRNEHDTHLSH